MSLFRRFKIFWMNNWVNITIIVSLILLLILSIWGLFALESFYRTLTLATLPLNLLMAVMNALVFVYLYTHVLQGGFGKMGRKMQINADDFKVTFKDVIGLENAKKEAMEVVALLKDRARVKAIGGSIIKGLLMVGPPGTGKTLLAKAIATEAGIPFLSIAGSEFVEVFVGVGASRVRKLFKKARQLAYAHGACIVFLDELDVIGRGRHFNSFGGGEETNSTQNQLLVEMDGLGEKQENVIVIGATNAAEGVLDKALLRPGRFDRKIFVDLPNLQERTELFRYYLRKIVHDPAIDIGRLARRCVQKSPADIMNICKESALIATRDKRSQITYRDISEAIERIDLGVAHPLSMSEQERQATAYHEAGHLLVLYNMHPTDDVFKASIIHRGGALGVVYHTPREELHSSTKDQILADIKVSLGGYMGEKIKYGVTSNGVAADFANAMGKAHTMVWRLGMGSNGFLGDYGVIPEHQLSDDIKSKLNQETYAILHQCAKDVEEFLRREWTLVDRFAQELVRRNELEYDDIHAIFAEYGKAREQVPIQTVTLDAPPAAPGA
ncbi:MAG TPA: AAA family ATPase [Elusimicrobiota bacterium]|jgi:cell division protease FtsH|nr:AAA family ATPase [Elusimicrobiota bacterium]HMX93663.1 AAA family ATPase [Elusimicrobiota bacterium]HNC73526.1 AAA family ATPase [Elusimicrobiota bacterium]HND63864.1 AAA family ATPase [Elusimicrobiota bacterium]HNF58055.1 AAA family ATPase [Elusimicrobiota bacterium]